MLAASRAVIRACVERRVPRMIVANSAALYGSYGAEGCVREDAAVRGYVASAYARARAHLSDFLDVIAASEYTGVLTRLRIGWIAGARNTEPVRHFLRLPAQVCGYEERVLPLVHEDDALAAIEHVLWHDVPGIYNVAAPDGVTFQDVATLLGRNRPCVPRAWVTWRAWWGWRWQGWPTPPLWSRSLVDGGRVCTDRLRAEGWFPRRTAREALVEAFDVLRSV